MVRCGREGIINEGRCHIYNEYPPQSFPPLLQLPVTTYLILHFMQMTQAVSSKMKFCLIHTRQSYSFKI